MFEIPAFMRELVARETSFGRVSVLEDTVHRAHILVNGRTWHGWQFRDPDRLDEPTGYYAPGSPLAEIFERLLPPDAKVAVAGLGAGVMAALASPGQSLTFFEINPAVIELARDARYFSFLERARGRCEVIVGDATERVMKQPPRHFDLVVADAFLDADVPRRMLTRDTLDRFMSRLTGDGILVFHVTSTMRGRDHRPEIARIAQGHACATRDWSSTRLRRDPTLEIAPEHDLSMPVECRWVAVGPRDAVDRLTAAFGWQPL